MAPVHRRQIDSMRPTSAAGSSPRIPARSPVSPIDIRSARVADADGIRAIYNAAVATTTATFDTEPRTPMAQRAWLRGHGTRFPVFVATAEGHVVGWSALSPWSDRPAYGQTGETSVYVSPPFQGSGIGGTLLDALIQRSKAGGFHTLLARIAEPNPPSSALHRSRGFRPVGTMQEVGYKFGRFIDVTLWQRQVEADSRI